MIGALKTMSPTPRAAALVAVVGSSGLAAPWPVTVIGLVVALVAIVHDATRAAVPPAVRRQIPQTLLVGRSTPYEVRAGSDGPGRDGVTVAQLLPAGLSATGEGLIAERRGRFSIESATATVTGPFGLGRWHHRIGTPVAVSAYPAARASARSLRPARRSAFGIGGQTVRGPLGLGTDFDSLREYGPDDDIRQVNWRASLRTGRPITNQFRTEQSRRVWAVVDCGRLTSTPSGARDPALSRGIDLAVDGAVALAQTADRLGDRVGLVAFDDEVRRHVPPRAGTAGRILEAAFDLEPSRHDSDFEAVAALVERGKRSLVMVFTVITDRPSTDPLVRAVTVMARRHDVVIVTSSDATLRDRLASATGDQPGAVYRVAAAARLREDRENALRTLRRSGATVLDVPPDRYTMSAVRAYVDAKLTARV